MSSTLAEAGRRYPRLRLGPTLVTLLGLVVLIGLGTWQLQRMEWKRELIATVEAQLALPTVELPPGRDLAGIDFRRFAVRGRYRHDAAVAYGLQASGSEPGAHLVTPFELEDGRIILVDRGWLPERLLPPAVPKELELEGVVALTGVARWRPEPSRNWATPADQPDRRRWFAWDVAAIAQATGLPLLPVVLVIDRPPAAEALPKPVAVTPELRNDHLGYAITWYGLAAGLLAVYLLYSFSRDTEHRP